MKRARKFLLRSALGAVALILLVFLAKTWIIPALIVGQIRARYGGRVTIAGWWLDGRSAGVVGLALAEGPGAEAPTWATVDRVSTDLTLGGLFRGRFTPRRITLQRPAVVYRIDRAGRPLTTIPLAAGGDGPLPAVVVEDAKVTIQQADRPAMLVQHVGARLEPRGDALRLSARADDPSWGNPVLGGRLDPQRGSVRVELTTSTLTVDPEQVRRIPWVPAEAWAHVRPRGPVRASATLAKGDGPAPWSVLATVTLEDTAVRAPTLGLDVAGTTGRLVVEGGLVRLDAIRGRALGGAVEARGSLDFRKVPARFDLDLGLERIEVADTPASWSLRDSGISGRLTGQAHLRATLDDQGVDLTGSTGRATIEGATVEGIKVKTIRLAMRAEGPELNFEQVEAPGDAWLIGPSALVAIALHALDADDPKAPEPRSKPKPKGVRLGPISTRLELEDVDLRQVVQKLAAWGIRLPFELAGKLSLKVRATIPLGKLHELPAYTFHGEATLTGAHVAGIDYGRLRAKLDLEKGVLELSELRGRLVDLPAGGASDHAEPTPDVPAEGPLPEGGFRGNLRAELSPPGRLKADFEGHVLPIGELVAPVLPRPTPIGGTLTVQARAEADVSHLTEAAAWSASGRLESAQLRYRSTTLDAVQTTFSVKDGRLDLPDLAARLGGQPLRAKARLGLQAPWAFESSLDVERWDLADVLAFVPSVPRPAPIAGKVSVRASAKGSLRPFAIESEGQGRLDRFRAGPVTLGDIPLTWRTEGPTLVVKALEAQPFGGRITADARIPTRGSGPIEGSIALHEVDLAELAGHLGDESLKISGKADGRAEFVVRRRDGPGESPIEVQASLKAPDLVVQGVPAENVQGVVTVDHGVIHYDLFAEALGGRIKLKGSAPWTGDGAPIEAGGEFGAVGFRLADVWPILGLGGSWARVTGLGAVHANIRSHLRPVDLRAHGIAEFRDLRLGPSYALGRVRSEFLLTPDGWRIGPIDGLILGGLARGSARDERPARGPRRLGFDFRLEDLPLREALAFQPELARRVAGRGRLRLNGQVREHLIAQAELAIRHANAFGLPLDDLRAPAELIYQPETGGSLRIERWGARLAGGRIEGDGRFRIGQRRDFQASLRLDAVDLEVLSRLETDVRRPSTGKISGPIRLEGTDATRPETYRGRIRLDLDDASLVSIPILRALSRVLGSAGGGLFDDGDLEATIARRSILIDQFTLVGPLAQLHARGTVRFDGLLDIEALVNTGPILPGLTGADAGALAGPLSARLLKFRISGPIQNPVVSRDSTVEVGESAAGFFGKVLRLPSAILP